LRNWRKQQ